MSNDSKPAAAADIATLEAEPAQAETIEGDVAEAQLSEAGDVEESAAGDGETLLELVLAEHEARAAERARIDGVVVGTIAALDASGAPIVTYPGGPEGGLAARAIAAIGPGDVGREVALLFEGGDPTRPLVMGKMHSPSAAPRTEVTTDGERLELRAEKEIVLSCGKASITLTRAGKVLIRGEYVLSRSSGVHRIQGGSVQIN
jgi:hypothetical protein